MKSLLDWLTSLGKQRSAATERRFAELARIVELVHRVELELDTARKAALAGKSPDFGSDLEQIEWGVQVWTVDQATADYYAAEVRRCRLAFVSLATEMIAVDKDLERLRKVCEKFRETFSREYASYWEARSKLLGVLATAARNQLPTPTSSKLPRWMRRGNGTT